MPVYSPACDARRGRTEPVRIQVWDYRKEYDEMRDEILAAVDNAGLVVADISTHEPDLEDLFMELTAGARRGG